MWVLISFIGVFASVALSIGQQKLKADTIPMLFWLRLISLGAAIPILFLFAVPPDKMSFYILAAIYALLIVWLDIVNFKYIADVGAAVAVRLGTIMSIPAFFLWVAVDHTTFNLYLDHPVRAVLILLVVCAAAYFASHLRHCIVTKDALKRLWPLMIHGTLGPTFGKLVILNNPDKFGAIITYLIVVCIVSVLALAIFMAVNKQRFAGSVMARHTIKSGMMLAAFSVTLVVSYYLAFMYVHNPVYVSLLFLTSPVIISIYNRFSGHPDDSNKIAGFGLVVCAMLIVGLKL